MAKWRSSTALLIVSVSGGYESHWASFQERTEEKGETMSIDDLFEFSSKGRKGNGIGVEGRIKGVQGFVFISFNIGDIQSIR